MEIEALLKMAHKAMFDIEDEHQETLISAFDVFLQQVEMINEIDTTGVEPQDFPLLVVKTHLREDEVSDVASTEALLLNASSKEANQIKVPAVIKR